MSGNVTAVVGLQYGDEGKGKIVDYLAEKSDVVIRANGGANAGHTIVLQNGKTLALHQIPSGIAYGSALNIIGNGSFVDPVKLVEEIKDAQSKNVDISEKNLTISSSAHLVLPVHRLKDSAREEGVGAQGSTKAGIAYVAADKALRSGIRCEYVLSSSENELYELAYNGLVEFGLAKADAKIQSSEFALAAISLLKYIKDSIVLVQQNVLQGKNILLEGAQAFGLDINHGKYPYVTSSDTTVSGLLSGSGINYKQVKEVIGVAKAIPSKVGGGEFVTRIEDKNIATASRGEKGKVDSEYGATTGREREVGYLDLVALKKGVEINGVDKIALTKFDCLIRHGKTTKVAIAYEYEGKQIKDAPSSSAELAKCTPVYKDFPTWSDPKSAEAEGYIQFIENFLETPIAFLGTGPNRDNLIIRKNK